MQNKWFFTWWRIKTLLPTGVDVVGVDAFQLKQKDEKEKRNSDQKQLPSGGHYCLARKTIESFIIVSTFNRNQVNLSDNWIEFDGCIGYNALEK